MSVAKELHELEQAMWSTATRCDRAWMEAHLTDDFVEYGLSGRVYDKSQTLDAPLGPFRAELEDLEVSRLSKDIALVTYRSEVIFGDAPPTHSNRSSIWVRSGGAWQLRFHQGTPC